MGSLLRFGRGRETGLLLAILAVVAVISVWGDPQAFFGRANLINMLRQIGLLGIFAVGEAVVIMAGGIDLSVGSLIAFSGMACAMVLDQLAAHVPYGQPAPPAALLAGLATGLAVGAGVGQLHALLITRLRLPPFIATMGTLAGLRSAAELVTRSVPITCPYPNLRALANGLTPLVFFAATAGLVAALMRYTVVGRQLIALGGNEEAARLSGLPTARLKAVSYTLCAVLAALAGLLYTAYNGQGDPRAGVGYELQAIAAVVVGGCALAGGVGSIAGVVLGVVLIQVTLNGIFLVVRSNSTQWQGLVVGVVVILAVALNNARPGRQALGETLCR